MSTRSFYGTDILFCFTIATLQTLILNNGSGGTLHYSDVFFWALMAGSFDLAKLCWPLTSRYSTPYCTAQHRVSYKTVCVHCTIFYPTHISL